MVAPTSRARRMNLSLVIGVAFGLLLIAALIVAIRLNDENTPAVPTLLAPEFSLPDLDESGSVSLKEYRGQIVLLNFWASWCPPCINEMPDLDAYYDEYRARGFVVLAINMGEDAAIARAFVKENGFDFPVALDLDGRVFASYGRQALPSSFIIGRNGELVKIYPAGMITRAHLERDVTPLLRR